uniref:Uncharacterized protein n=1 Tax=Triticum urartu TaxID=4572 RepID=A0A8R7UJ99_TRIUA
CCVALSPPGQGDTYRSPAAPSSLTPLPLPLSCRFILHATALLPLLYQSPLPRRQTQRSASRRRPWRRTREPSRPSTPTSRSPTGSPRSPSPTTRGTWRSTRSAWGPAARTPSTTRSSTSCTTGTASATSRCFLPLFLYFLTRTAMGVELLMCLAFSKTDMSLLRFTFFLFCIFANFPYFAHFFLVLVFQLSRFCELEF